MLSNVLMQRQVQLTLTGSFFLLFNHLFSPGQQNMGFGGLCVESAFGAACFSTIFSFVDQLSLGV